MTTQKPSGQGLRELVAKWRDEADGVTAMGYSQQGDRMRDCADELESLLTTEVESTPSGGWQDISTAPKGGGAGRTDDPAWVEPPRILRWSASKGLMVVYWDWYYAEGGNGYQPGCTAWVDDAEADPLWPQDAPTHWMPLPAPPPASQENQP